MDRQPSLNGPSEGETKPLPEGLSKREQMKLDQAIKIIQSQEVRPASLRINRFANPNAEAHPTCPTLTTILASKSRYALPHADRLSNSPSHLRRYHVFLLPVARTQLLHPPAPSPTVPPTSQPPEPPLLSPRRYIFG